MYYTTEAAARRASQQSSEHPDTTFYVVRNRSGYSVMSADSYIRSRYTFYHLVTSFKDGKDIGLNNLLNDVLKGKEG